MRYTSICLALLISAASAGPLFAAEKNAQGQTLILKKKKIIPGAGATITETGGISYLNASDCRLNGGDVITPGDNRCGAMGAAYCRYKDGNAACLTE